MKELTLRKIENLLVMMSGIQEEHPKADVTYDPEKERINITYTLAGKVAEQPHLTKHLHETLDSVCERIC